jgi:hypothetical protein
MFEFAVEELLGNGGVAARGAVVQVEHERQVQRVRSDGQGLVEDSVAADVLKVDPT